MSACRRRADVEQTQSRRRAGVEQTQSCSHGSGRGRKTSRATPLRRIFYLCPSIVQHLHLCRITYNNKSWIHRLQKIVHIKKSWNNTHKVSWPFIRISWPGFLFSRSKAGKASSSWPSNTGGWSLSWRWTQPFGSASDSVSVLRAQLVPVFSFGENELFDQMENPAGSSLRRLQVSWKEPFQHQRRIQSNLIDYLIGFCRMSQLTD